MAAPSIKRLLRWGLIFAATLATYLATRDAPVEVETTDRGGRAATEIGDEIRVAIDERHIFDGEINRRGEPVGFHARPEGREPANARIARVRDRPNRLGVYTATVEIRDPASGRWLEKRSSFFPDALGRDDVLAAIRHAWASRETGNADRFRGPSGLGFTVEGWADADAGRIRTAYPIYRRDR